LKSLPIALPPVELQNRIAGILSAYDDLIENNRRRMALLEEATRLLYREWFVRLRFPGHEHTRITHGVPEGWERKTLAQVAEVNRESLGSSVDGEIEYVDIASVTPGQINETATYDLRDAPSRARRVVRHGDIIWSCVRPNRRSHAVIWQPPSNLIVSTGFAVLSPHSVPTTFLYFATTTDTFVGYLENHAKGAAYPAVVAGDFERSDLLVPSRSLLDSFNDFVEPTLTQSHSLQVHNRNLRAARDLLLPRLMSGEIQV
jgi:type I restriction enzyme S subunit